LCQCAVASILGFKYWCYVFMNSDTMNNRPIAVLFVLILIVSSVVMTIDVGGSDASFVVRDGEGTSFTFDSPVDHIITIGVGATATAIGVGALDKIVVCDSYSKTNSDPIFDDLKRYVEEGRIAANGNIYNSGKEQLKIDIIDAAEPTKGRFDKDRDVIFAVASPSYRGNLDFLAENGFRNVMYWNTVDDYGDIVDFVETISMVCNGKIVDSAASMRLVVDTITSTLDKTNIARAKAFYITYSGGEYKVGNTTSITTVMLEAAGGVVITKDPSKPDSTITVNLTKLVEENPTVKIFADHQVYTSEEHMKNIRIQVGNDVPIYGLESIWNNFSIESAKGVWLMASALYPELFEGDMPVPTEPQDTVFMYFCAGMVAVAIILIGSYLFMRTPSRPRKRSEE